MRGERRFGKPRSDAERAVRHKRIHGADSPLPPRGTGRRKIVKKRKKR